MENNFSHLVVSFDEFKQELDTVIAAGNDLISLNVDNEPQLDALTKSWQEWVSTTRNYIKSAFADPNSDFLISFDQAREQNFHFANVYGRAQQQPSLQSRIQKVKKDIEIKIQHINYNLRLTAHCDLIINNLAAAAPRRTSTTEQKINFLLDKLYELNDDGKYPIEMLLVGNGFVMKNYNEARDIANVLTNLGLIETAPGSVDDIYASITVQGALQIEQALKTNVAEKTAGRPASNVFNNIFIVHGHNHGMKETVARAVQTLGFNPIILHEMPNQGRTVIEKFTDHSDDVQYAIVLLSADDFAYQKDSTHEHGKLRPRQNVVFELGYFIGKLGRERVFPLFETLDNFEIHSDFAGVVLVPFDSKGAWKMDLGKELEALGVDVDWKALMK